MPLGPEKFDVEGLIREGAARLKLSPTPRLDAELLLAHAMGVSRGEIMLTRGVSVGREAAAMFRVYMERRERNEPIAYIVGFKHWHNYTFKVNPSVLVPRPETELMAEHILEEFPQEELSVIDIGTGSGCIGITLALERPGWRVTATDVSEEALDVARENARELGAENITFIHADLLEGVEGRFDIAVSNPPYVNPKDAEDLPDDVRAYEPHRALFAPCGGMQVIRTLLKELPGWLKPGGRFYCEIGYDQKERAIAAAEKAGWVKVEVREDLAGLDRILVASLQDG